MDSHTLLLPFFFFFILFRYTAFCFTADICSPSSCGDIGPEVRFPFRLKVRRPERCGYPGFDLSCKTQNRTVLNLPFSGDFLVTKIDYKLQHVYINDPDFCLPKRILRLNLSGSSFRGDKMINYTFYNCSSEWVQYANYGAVPVYCLNGPNYTVVATSSSDPSSAPGLPSYCKFISSVRVPVQINSPSTMDLSKDLLLTWSGAPRCGPCEAQGGTCLFKDDTGLDIDCVGMPRHGLPRSAKYGIILGAGIPGLICLIGFISYIGSKLQGCCCRQRQRNVEPSSGGQHVSIVVTGLDRQTIESYPKTVLGDSGRFSESGDGTCSICLAEYKPKETLRTLPDCNHHFHVSCIDSWLAVNATCPLCRKTPDDSSIVTPCSSSSSSSRRP